MLIYTLLRFHECHEIALSVRNLAKHLLSRFFLSYKWVLHKARWLPCRILSSPNYGKVWQEVYNPSNVCLHNTHTRLANSTRKQGDLSHPTSPTHLYLNSRSGCCFEFQLNIFPCILHIQRNIRPTFGDCGVAKPDSTASNMKVIAVACKNNVLVSQTQSEVKLNNNLKMIKKRYVCIITYSHRWQQV